MHRMFVIVLAMILSPGIVCASDDMADNTFKSPTGRYTVKIRELHHYIAPPNTGNVDDVNHIRYAIIFLNATNPNYYVADYNDVYDARTDKTPGPTAKRQIFSSITWSPKDDFAVLPEEDWARCPGSPFRTTMNLNIKSTNKWTKATLHMNDLIWADDFRVFGNVNDDCEYYVSMFDGKAGKTIIVVPARSPVGFGIIATRDRTLIIKSRLDNCRTDEDEKAFIAECRSVNMDSLREEKTKCP